MYCLSSDGSTLVDAKLLNISQRSTGEKNKVIYAVLANKEIPMIQCNTLEEAKYSLKMVMTSIVAGRRKHEF